MRIGTLVGVLAMMAPVLWVEWASADDPNLAGPAMYCVNRSPYGPNDRSPVADAWVGECYHIYDVLPPTPSAFQNPGQAQCAQSWQNHQNEFRAVLEGDFMYMCSDPFPDPRRGFRQLPPR